MRINWLPAKPTRACLPFLWLLAALPATAAPSSGIIVVGQVRATGAPLARARVELFPLESAYERGQRRLGVPSPPARAGALSDTGGWFRITAPESGMWRLVATAPGYVPMEYPLFPLTEDTDVPTVELPRDSSLQIRVVTGNGSPVAGARVLTTPFRPRDAYTPWKPSWEPAEQLGTTDVNGRLLLPGSGDSLRIEAQAPGHLASIFSGTRSSRPEIRLSRATEQSVQVKDPKGRPAAGAQAWLEGPEIPGAVSDPQGRLSLALPMGKQLRIRFLGNGGELADVDLAFNPKTPKPVTVHQQAPVTLTGRVLSFPDRIPISGALVWPGGDFSTAVRTDRAGAYTLPLGSAGPLRAAATGFFEDSVAGPLAASGPSFALRPKTFLPGSVTDERGRAVADVEIRARYDAAVVRRADATLRSSGGLTRSRQTGLFRVDRLVPEADYTLRFARDGFAPKVIRVKAPEPGAPPERLRIVLSTGIKASGLVRDRQDRPVPGAVVELRPATPNDAVARLRVLGDPDPALSRKAASDAQGRFELPSLASGTFDLSVRAAGFADALISGIELPDNTGPLDLGTVVLEGEAVLTGMVRGTDGQPLEGADVRIVPTASLLGGPQGAPDAVTGSGGRFEIRGQRPGARLKLSAERSGYAPAQASGVTAPNEEPVVLVLAPRGSISGRVVDADSHPVPGIALQAVSVKMEIVEGATVKGGRATETRSHEDGSFVLDGVEPGPVELTGSEAGWQESTLQIRLPVGQNLEGVELVLHKAALLEGRVLGPDGNPVARAEIGRYEPPREGVIRYRAPLALSDADGRYRIGGLAPGHLSLAARHVALGQSIRDLDVQPGDNTLDFELTGGHAVSGRVLDSSGAPARDARVSLRSNSSAAGPPDAMSDADGSFRFEGISAGSYRLDAVKEGEGRTRQLVQITVAEAPLEGVILEIVSPVAIRGRILGLTVDELAQVQVSAGWGAGSSTVAYDGSYRIEDLTPGTWRVVADLPRTGRRTEGEVTLEADADAELDLDFGEGLTLSGRFRKNSRSLAGATITLRGTDALPASAETGPDGRFELHGLAAGVYRLEVSDYRTGVLLARQIQLQQDQEILLDLRAAALEGVVLDARDRQPLGQVEITLTSLEAGDQVGVDRRIVSSPDGTFVFDEVGEGSWKMIAARPGFTPKEQVLSLGGTPQHFEVLLAPASGSAQVGSPP
jgi:Carboxypeptidase regulatory-like domain